MKQVFLFLVIVFLFGCSTIVEKSASSKDSHTINRKIATPDKSAQYGTSAFSGCLSGGGYISFFKPQTFENDPSKLSTGYHMLLNRYLGYGGLRRGCEILVTGSEAIKVTLGINTLWKIQKFDQNKMIFNHPKKESVTLELRCDVSSSNKYPVNGEDVLNHISENQIGLYCSESTSDGYQRVEVL